MSVSKTEYVDFLQNSVFKTKEQGQFSILFELFDYIDRHENSLSILERSYIYDGMSIFAGLAPNTNPQVIDYIPNQSSSRTGFQKSWLNECHFHFPRSTGEIIEKDSDIAVTKNWKGTEAFVLPNVIHHCCDLNLLLKEITSHGQLTERIYIFDSYLREEHQVPDDYCRYTPAAIDFIMKRIGYRKFWETEYGNVFDGILYLSQQAQVIVDSYQELSDIRNTLAVLNSQLQLVKNDKKYVTLGRKHARMVTSYALGYELAQ